MKRVCPLRQTVILLACVLLAAGAGFATTKKPPLRPININTATSNELQLVPGIGPATAEKILTMRKSYGPFKSVDDLLAIKGLGRKRLDKMRKYLTVGKAPSVNKPAEPVGKGTVPTKAPEHRAAPAEQPPEEDPATPEPSEDPPASIAEAYHEADVLCGLGPAFSRSTFEGCC